MTSEIDKLEPSLAELGVKIDRLLAQRDALAEALKWALYFIEEESPAYERAKDLGGDNWEAYQGKLDQARDALASLEKP